MNAHPRLTRRAGAPRDGEPLVTDQHAVRIRLVLVQLNSRKNAGRAGSDDDNVKFFHVHSLRQPQGGLLLIGDKFPQ